MTCFTTGRGAQRLQIEVAGGKTPSKTQRVIGLILLASSRRRPGERGYDIWKRLNGRRSCKGNCNRKKPWDCDQMICHGATTMDTDESTHMGVIWESNVFIYLQLLMGLPCGQSYVLGDAPSRENRPRLAMACEARLVPGAHQPMTSMTPTSTPHLAAVISRLRSRAYLKSIDFWQCIDLLFFFLFPLSRDHGPGNARSSTRRCRARPSLPHLPASPLHSREDPMQPFAVRIMYGTMG